MNNLVFSATLLWVILQNLLLWAHRMLYSFTISLPFSNMSKRSTQLALSYKMVTLFDGCFGCSRVKMQCRAGGAGSAGRLVGGDIVVIVTGSSTECPVAAWRPQ